MALTTYEAIDSKIFTSSASSFSFTSIPGTFTDLVIIARLKNTTGNNYEAYFTFNSDTGTNYSFNFAQNYSGSVQAGSNQSVNQNRNFKTNSSGFGSHEANIMNYTQTNNMYKQVLSRTGSAVGTQFTGMGSSMWRSNSAITSITFTMESGADFAVGSKLDLYGIKAAV